MIFLYFYLAFFSFYSFEVHFESKSKAVLKKTNFFKASSFQQVSKATIILNDMCVQGMDSKTRKQF